MRDVQYVVSKGLENRRRRHHSLNSESSRSHAMFSVYLDAAPRDGSKMPATRYGRISILDLAGSENVRTTQSHGAGLKEAGAINRSLFALGQVRLPPRAPRQPLKSIPPCSPPPPLLRR